MPHSKPPYTWILAADAAQAAVWECKSKDAPLTSVPDFNLTAADTHGFARDLKSDRPGRAFASTGDRRSAMEPPHDPHELAKTRFMREIAGKLETAAQDGRFQRLIVIAPPRMLGILRQEYGQAVRKAIAGEIDKDLTKASPSDILSHAQPHL